MQFQSDPIDESAFFSFWRPVVGEKGWSPDGSRLAGKIPEDLDLGYYRAVTIWCRRFSVNFGTAPLVRLGS